MSNHLALITQTQSLIASGDIVGAEYALAELADTQGDRALMEVIAQLPAKDVLAVIREYDSSRDSVVNLLITPEQFARAFHRRQQGGISKVFWWTGLFFIQSTVDTEQVVAFDYVGQFKRRELLILCIAFAFRQ